MPCLFNNTCWVKGGSPPAIYQEMYTHKKHKKKKKHQRTNTEIIRENNVLKKLGYGKDTHTSLQLSCLNTPPQLSQLRSLLINFKSGGPKHIHIAGLDINEYVDGGDVSDESDDDNDDEDEDDDDAVGKDENI